MTLQAKYLAEQAEMENDSQFSVSQQEQTTKGAMMENATDIKVLKKLMLYNEVP